MAEQIIKSIGPDNKEIISNVLGQYVGEYRTYKEVEDYIDGTPMSDAKLDPNRLIYIKNSGKYFKLVSNKDIDLESVGVIYNDELAAISNLDIITLLINLNYNIVVKDVLYLSGTNKTIVANNISIHGDSVRSHIIYTGGTMFNIPNVFDSYSLTNIKITTTSLFQFFSKSGVDFTIKNIILNDLNVFGPVSLRLAANLNANSKVEYIEVNRNRFRDLKNSVIQLTDVLYDKVLVDNNQIDGLDYPFLSDGIMNNNPFVNDIRFGKKLLIVSNNTVINPPDRFLITMSGLYMCFILTESYESHYFGNYVEGLKAVTDAAIYDIYQSSIISYYHDNFWKNNMCFVPVNDVGTKALYKGKGGDFKYVYNNTFIVEKSFLEKFIADNAEYSLDILDCWVSYNSLDTSDSTNIHFYYKDNIVDVFYLNNTVSVNNRVTKYEIENNTFKCHYNKSYFMSLRTGYYNDKRTFLFNNNNIEIKEALGTDSWSVCAGNGSVPLQNEQTSIEFNNNTITTFSRTRLFSSCRIDILYFNNNIINSFLYLHVFYTYTFKTLLKGDNNTITSNSSDCYVYYIAGDSSAAKIDFKYTINLYNSKNDSVSGLTLFNKDYDYVMQKKIILSCPEYGETEVSVLMLRKIIEGRSYIQYRDDLGVIQEIELTPEWIVPGASQASLHRFRNLRNNSVIATLRIYKSDKNEVILSLMLTNINNYTIKITDNVQ